jgi:hypothetical protein
MATASYWYGDITYNTIIPEPVNDILSAFIAQAMEEEGLEEKEEWYQDLHYDFDERARGHRPDMSSKDFIDDLENKPNREDELTALLEKVKDKIAGEEEILTTERLEEFEQLKDWGEEYQTNWEGRYLKRDDFLHALDNIIQLINHQWDKEDFKAPFEGYLPGGWPEE